MGADAKGGTVGYMHYLQAAVTTIIVSVPIPRTKPCTPRVEGCLQRVHICADCMGSHTASTTVLTAEMDSIARNDGSTRC